MKKISKIVLVTILAVMLMCVSLVSAFAAGTLTVNGNEAPVGGTVTYSFNIADAHQKIAGIHMVIFFDQDCLALESVDAENLDGSTINDNQSGNGQIIIVNSLINGASGLACSDKTELVSVTFKVLAEGETDITYYIPYLYDIDLVNIYDYTLTCDIAVDGDVVAPDKTPELHDVSSLDGFDAGDFENSPEGTGSGVKPVVTQVPQGNNEQSGGTEDNANGTNPTTIIGIVCACVLVAAIVLLVVIKSKGNKKDSSAE